MKCKLLSTALVVASFLLSGCATGVKSENQTTWSKDSDFTTTGYQEVQFDTNPQYSKIVVRDAYLNQIIYSGQTPARIPLKLANNYMTGKIYKVSVAQKGYEDIVFLLKPTTSLHYSVGNILNILGYFVADPQTGEMWNLVHNSKDQRIKRISDNVLLITFPKNEPTQEVVAQNNVSTESLAKHVKENEINNEAPTVQQAQEAADASEAEASAEE